MQAWLEFVVKGLVDQPAEVTVTPVDRGGSVHYELRLAPDDVGKLVGRHGATIKALRALLQVGGARQGRRLTVDIVEDDAPPA